MCILKEFEREKEPYFYTVTERKRNNPILLFEEKERARGRILVLVSQNAIRAKRSIQQQYNNQIIISFLYTTDAFFYNK